MATCIEIKSKEMIKPSSPTPPHLKTHKLFFLDQLMPTCYMSIILFFKSDDNSSITEKSKQFKESLSRTLTLFYPLAGRNTGNLSIDCSDEGAEYVEALVHTQLSNVLKEPKMDELMKNLVPKRAQEIALENIPLAIKVNFFDCGGIAIGASMLHAMADVKSLAIFMHAWAATCRGDKEIVPPVFGAAPYPPIDLSKTTFTAELDLCNNKEKLTAKRIVFEKEKLDKLKEIARVDLKKNPSRVEVASASIWKHFILNSKNPGNMFGSNQAVDVRLRMSKPVSPTAFGNIVSFEETAMLMPDEDDKSFSNLIGKFQEAIKNMDADFHLKCVERDDYEEVLIDDLNKFMDMATKEDVKLCYFSSWCGYGFRWYELNFGWGEPIYVCPGNAPYKNLVILIDGRFGEVEAWINMLESDDFNEQSFYMYLDKLVSPSINY